MADTPKDAGVFVQKMVDNVIGNQLNEIHPQRTVALSFRRHDHIHYIKLLCFDDSQRNCIHVKIRVDKDGINHYAGKVAEMKMVHDDIDTKANYEV